MSEFVEVYSITTGIRQLVPAHWVGDPVVGADFRKTPAQRELDGELGPRPREESTVKEIDAYADFAGISLTGLSTKTEKLTAVEAVFATGQLQTGLIPIEPPVVEDPAELAPAVDTVPSVDPAPPVVDPAHPAADPNPDGNPPSGAPTPETPAAGDKE